MENKTFSKAEDTMVAAPERTLVLTRIINAPREIVFKVWTEPRHLSQWWGPRGFTNPVCRINAKPSGEIYIDMKGPDGVVYPMAGTVREVNSGKKLVFAAQPLDENGNPFFEVLNTITFEDSNGGTRLTIRAEVSNINGGSQHLKGMEEGWNQSLVRLTDILVNPEKLDRELVISRLLNAPRELVFKVWTDPEHIKNWWGPNGFTNTISKMDIKPGGEWDLVMHGPDGTNYKNKSVFREIVKPERIVYDHISGPKFLATITFTAEGKKTHIKWSMLFESKESFEQTVKTFGADEGLKQNIEKLDQYLANLK